jgi:putative peptide zinc metalloprotease protein
VVGKFISPVGWIVWATVVVTALALVLPEWQRLRESATDAMAPGNWFWLWIVFVVTKFIHELGHAFACRRFGGEVHEMGVMFLVFIPTPYVDASTAWGFANKWKRLFVGAAGMWIELFVASLCALAWLATGQGTLLNQLLYNAMLIASVSTVLFNANPLLRYDGYYMLSDYLEMPNLQMRSRDYILGLIKRHAFRVKATQPLPPPAQRGILFSYGVLSTTYRLFIGFAIMIMVLYQLPEEVKILGLLMGAGALATWLVVPLVKGVKYLALDPELHRKRSRAWAYSLSAAAVVLILVGLIRFDVDVYAEGVIEAQQKVVLFGKSQGFIREIHAQDGQILKTNDVILVAYDAGLESALKQAQARLTALEMRQRLSRAKAESYAQSMIDQGEIDATREHLKELQRQWDELTIRAPIDGQLIMPDIEQTQGRYIQRGQELGKVLSTGMMKVRATLDQRDAQLATNAPDSARAEVRLSSKPDDTLYAQEFTLTPAAQERLPSVALGHAGGGTYAIDPKDPKGTKPIERQFELLIRLSAADGQLEFYPGQRAYVRLKLDRQTLAWQGIRRLMQLIQTTSNAKALS